MVMPSGLMDRQSLQTYPAPSESLSSSSSFSEELHIPERRVGFWDPKPVPDRKGISVFRSPLEKQHPHGANLLRGWDLRHPSEGQKPELSFLKDLIQKDTMHSSLASWQDAFLECGGYTNFSVNGSPFAESKEMNLQVGYSNLEKFHSNYTTGQSIDTNEFNSAEEEPFESAEEIEARTIGDLLPDDDDLISFTYDDYEGTKLPALQDDEDIFYTGGGMELETDDCVKTTKVSQDKPYSPFSVGTAPGEHSSRTLIIRNVNGNIDDAELRILLEEFGDIDVLDAAAKNQGIVVVSYCDIRAACKAIRALQDKSLGNLKVEMQISIEKIPETSKGCNGQFRFADVTADALNASDGVNQTVKLERSDSQCIKPSSVQEHSLWLKHQHCGGCDLCGSNLPTSQLGLVASKSMKDGAVHGSYSPISPLAEMNAAFDVFHAVHQGSHAALRTIPAGQYENHHLLPDLAQSPVQPNSGFQGTQNLHSQALLDGRNSYGVSGLGSCPLHGHHNVWAVQQAFRQHPSVPLLWPNTPSHLPMHLHGFSSSCTPMLNHVYPLEQHHVGSAPIFSSDPAGLPSHQGSCRSMAFPGSPQLLPVDLASCDLHGARSMGEPFIVPVVGIPLPQQRPNVLPVRNRNSSSFDARHDRTKHRRHVANPAQTDSKNQFDLDIDRISRAEDSRTTLMIKNIPNKYTCKMLLAVIDEFHRGTYDFIYLPIDFKNNCNVGYAFINMTDAQKIIPFYKTFNGKKWEKFNSEKVASLAYARIQGRAALIAHFENSSLMNEDKRCRPMLFHTEGPHAGDQEPFPVGTHVRSRPARNRASENEGNHHESPEIVVSRSSSSSSAGSMKHSL